MNTHIDEHRKIDSYLSRYQKAIDCVERALDEMATAEGLISDIDNYAISDAFASERFYGMDRSKEVVALKFKKRLSVSLWRFLHRKTGLYRLMDATANEEFEKQLESDPPPCTLENLEATFSALRGDQKLIFNRGVVRAFKRLDRSYKTNDAFKINKRIILRNCTGVHSSTQDEIFDIERIFHIMDGKEIPQYDASVRAVIDAHRHGRDSLQGIVETDYMNMHFYLNGNCHVTFTRPDLIERCNQIIAAYHGENKLP